MSVVTTITLPTNATGASTVDTKVKGNFDVLSWHWGLTQAASAALGNTNQGSADVHDLTFTKVADQGTPKLISDCFGAISQGDATLSLWNTASGSTWPYMTIKMTGNVIISSYNAGEYDSQDRLLETITLNFAKVQVVYTPQKSLTDKSAAPDVTGKLLDIAKHCFG
jgi:type VI secretion system secreted protein Hcp